MSEAMGPTPVATLTWGVKQSFRQYVEAAGGGIETGAGVGRAADGAFVFAAAADGGLALDAAGRPAGAGRFLGEVGFKAHGGMLSVNLAELGVEIGPDGAALSVADGRGGRVALATLDLAAASRDADGALVIPAALSMDGWQVLGDHYPPRTALDPVRLELVAAS